MDATPTKQLVGLKVLILLLFGGAWNLTQVAQADDEASLRELESYELLRLFKTAPPPPLPPSPVYSDIESGPG